MKEEKEPAVETQGEDWVWRTTHVQTLKEKSLLLHLTMMTTRGQTWTTAPRAPGPAPTMQFRWLIGWTGILREGQNLTHLTPMSAVESWRAPGNRFFWLLVTTYWHWSPNRDDSRGQQLPLLQLQSVCSQCSLKGLIRYCPRWREKHKTGQPQWETETSQSSVCETPSMSDFCPLPSSVFFSLCLYLASLFSQLCFYVFSKATGVSVRENQFSSF